MKILITGIHGFVGTNMVEAFKETSMIFGLDIITLPNPGVSKSFAWNDLEHIPSVDVIIHLAGKAHDLKKVSSEQEYYDINVGLTKKINGGTIGLDDRNRRWESALSILGGEMPAPKKAAPEKAAGVRTLRKGMKGDDVAKMQKAIGVGADGDFGFGTLTAVKKWQKMNGLVADGIVGPATQAKMFK